MVFTVKLTRTASSNIKKLPRHILAALFDWVQDVARIGLEQVRLRPGLHDEPLLGKREGQRSVRLSREYRLIYQLEMEGDHRFVLVLEINKHKY